MVKQDVNPHLSMSQNLQAYIGKRKIIAFAFHFFHFKTFSGKEEKWFFHFFQFHYRFWKVIFSLSLSLLKSDFFTFFTFTFAFEKWKNHFSSFPEKVLKWKKWKAKVKSESDYFSRSNVQCQYLRTFLSNII